MKKLFTLAAVAAMMFSCSKSEDVTPDAGKLPINISIGQQTRANDTTYENGDEVGVYVVNYNGATAGTLATSGNQVDNAHFTFDGSKWSPENSIYWKDKSTAADFYAYYPYSESTNISAHPFSVQANQSSENAFWASDFLWGKATKVSPTKNAVPIVTNHSLSRILVDIKPGNGFTAESWAAATKSVKICDVKASATIDLSTGIATATGNNGEIIPLAAAETGTTLSYKAMIVPQVVANNSKLVVVTVDGTDYVYRKGYTFQANTQHTFTVTVNKSGSNVDVTIGEWTIDDTTNEGDAEDESESEAIIPNNQIWYTATAKVEPSASADFGATIESNEWDSTTGKGIITFNGEVISIGEQAFFYKYNLKTIILPNGVTKIEDEAFKHCSELTQVILPNRLLSIGNEAFNLCDALVEITIPNSVVSVGSYAIGSPKLTSITIPNSVTTIGDNAFKNCKNLTAFYGKFASNDNRCLIVDGVINSFARAGLTTYTIPNNVTSIGAEAFGGSELQGVVIPNSVKEIGENAFSDSNSLLRVDIPSSVISIGYGAFSYCDNLNSVTISNSVTAIGDYAFCGCVNLQEITMPNSITAIGNSVFSLCKKLQSITIPSGVISIGNNAFNECLYLLEITIPDSVKSIGEKAFYYCQRLEKVYCKGIEPPTLYRNVFDENKSDRKFYVPLEAVETYKNTGWWGSSYADCIFADPTEN